MLVGRYVVGDVVQNKHQLKLKLGTHCFWLSLWEVLNGNIAFVLKVNRILKIKSFYVYVWLKQQISIQCTYIVVIFAS